MELFAAIAVLGIIAAIIVPRTVNNHDSAKVSACHVNRGDIEVQAQIWLHNTGSWPAGNLSDISADVNYFPEGVPTCPVDGTAYTINTVTGRVIGHDH